MEVFADMHIHIGRSENGKPIKITASRELRFENIMVYLYLHIYLHHIKVIMDIV